MKIGYVRVSTVEQNTARQEVLMEQLKVDKVYIDRCSGKNANRPQLQEMMSFVREGDTVVVESISRFARNTKDLLNLIDQLKEKGVEFESQKEKIDTSTPTGQFMLTIFGAVAQLEREYTLQRQNEGIAIAKENGIYRGRQPIKVDDKQFAKEYQLFRDGHISAAEAMNHLGLKPNTFYRRVKKYEAENRIEPSAVELNKARRNNI